MGFRPIKNNIALKRNKGYSTRNTGFRPIKNNIALKQKAKL